MENYLLKYKTETNSVIVKIINKNLQLMNKNL